MSASDYDVAELLEAIGGPIYDFSLTPPNPEILQYYHPYPEHLANYNRVYQSSSEKSELDDFEGKPLSDFMDFLSGSGVDKCSIKARDLETTFGMKIPNANIADLVHQFPDRVIGFAGIDPYKGMNGVRELEYCVTSLGLRGLNLQLYELLMPANDKKLYPLYAKCCELNIPVNVHMSINFSTKSLMKYGHPLSLDEVAVDFPELVLIAGPPGWPYFIKLLLG